MFAIEARKMGYRVHTFSPESDTPTGQVADIETNAAYQDLDAVRKFAASVDVVTFEFENQDEADHNIVSKEGAFQEVILGGSQKKTVDWTAPSKAGTFKFVCTYHRGMEMTVHVR